MVPIKGIVKLYYSIKEVANRLGVSESALRTWEREFPNLQPKRNNSGDRKYKEEDIKQIELIIDLRKTKKLTVAGAKDYIKAKSHKKVENEDLIIKLKNIKSFLVDLRDNLDNTSENEKPIGESNNEFNALVAQDSLEELIFQDTLDLENSFTENTEIDNSLVVEKIEIENENKDLIYIEEVNAEQIFEEELFENELIEEVIIEENIIVENIIVENFKENEKIQESEQINVDNVKDSENLVHKNLKEDNQNAKGGQQASLF